MAFTNEDIQAIERAIADGVLIVQYADRKVTYQSMDSLIRARDLMKGEVDSAAGKAPRRRTFRVFQSGTGY